MFTLPKLIIRERKIGTIAHYLTNLSHDKAWSVTVEELKTTRSNQQNRFLWGIVYPLLLVRLPGWDSADVHDYFLGEWAGWQRLEGLGRSRLKPIKRSSRLSTTEFSDFVAFIQRKAAEMGIDIPEPNEEVA